MKKGYEEERKRDTEGRESERRKEGKSGGMRDVLISSLSNIVINAIIIILITLINKHNYYFA